jgi:aryl-alcohol dehydrogenase-like predicted oxidoreductase
VTQNRTLTLAGTEVARIGLGTNRLTPTPENERFLKDAVAAGIGMIDTAHLYTGGESEEAIGAALSPFPEDLIVATKGGYNRGDGSPDALRAQLDESLQRLRTDSIDLYYLHRVDPETPLEESLGAIAEFRHAGKVREIGISEVSVDQIERAREIVPIAAVQNNYSLGERKHEEVVDYCTEEGIVFVPYFPLRGSEGRPRDALAWLLERSPVMLPIPGTLSLDHMKENLAALDALAVD